MILRKGYKVLAPDRFKMVRNPATNKELPALTVMEVVFVSSNLNTWVTLYNGEYNQSVWADKISHTNCAEVGTCFNPFTLERM